MNRQERRKRARKGKKMQERSNKRINSVEYEHIMATFNVAKLASMLSLRDKGYGKKRLMEFSDKFNMILTDISAANLATLDIVKVLEDETGISLEDIKVR